MMITASPSTGTHLLLILFFGVFVAVEVNGRTAGGGGSVGLVSGSSEQREFDYFAFCVQWPPTYCSKSSKCCAKNACCRGSNAPTEFTIHGLWPDYNDGTWPSCCSGSAFDKEKISPLLGALEKYWPSLSCSKSSTCHGSKGLFWAHEWEKHGTCASSVTQDEYNYFLTTINFYFTYNITGVLFDAGYVPSNTEKYPEGGIISAIENAFHTTPQLTCTKGALEEVRLCLNKDFTFRDCVAGSTCPEYVSLPLYASLELNTTQTEDLLFSGRESF